MTGDEKVIDPPPSSLDWDRSIMKKKTQKKKGLTFAPISGSSLCGRGATSGSAK